jgi:glutamine amidotransferase
VLVIVDYQMGNLRSVQKALEHVGCAATISADPAVVAAASKVILPGVGAFGDAMAELRRRELVDPLREFIASGRPFLGICLGLQLLFDVSHEGGRHEGLGALRGEVRRFDLPHEYKVPHMGWNQVQYRRRPPIFADVPDESYFYFVHSYYVVPEDESLVAGEARYGDPFCAMIWRDNLFATQFHPEKSQKLGLAVLRRFAELA